MQTAQALGNKWTGAWGDYFNYSVSFDLTAQIDDDNSKDMTITCNINNLKFSYNFGTNFGYGFINVGGIEWGEAPIYNYATYSDDTTTGDTLAMVYSEMEAAGIIISDIICAVWASDKKTAEAEGMFGYINNSISHTWTHMTWDELDDLILVQSFERFRDNDYDLARTEGAELCNIDFKSLFPDYFPGAHMLSKGWESNNTDGKGFYRYNGSEWIPRRNSRFIEENNTVYIKSGNSWIRANQY